MISIIAGRMGHQTEHAIALAEGLRAHEVEAKILHSWQAPVSTKLVACWGWRYGRGFRERGHEVLVMERGYIAPPGDPDRLRFKWTSLGWNGLNGQAEFRAPEDGRRFARHFGSLMKPWKSGGEIVLIAGQVPGDASLAGRDLAPWYEASAREAAKAYGLPVYFRPHPMAIRRGIRQQVRAAPTMDGELDSALTRAAVVVTYNSNTAVEAVLAGVPTITMDRGSMAWDVTGHEIGERLTPPREGWAARLAWCQWTMDEIRSGEAWEMVRPYETADV